MGHEPSGRAPAPSIPRQMTLTRHLAGGLRHAACAAISKLAVIELMEETSIELVDESKSPGDADVESSGGASEGAPVAPIDATLLVRANSESFINSPSHTVVDSAWRVFHHILDADGDGNVSIAELHDIVAAINPPGERVTPKARALLSHGCHHEKQGGEHYKGRESLPSPSSALQTNLLL